MYHYYVHNDTDYHLIINYSQLSTLKHTTQMEDGRYINHSLPNPIPCVLDKPEVLAEDTKQPRFLPWEFDTKLKELIFLNLKTEKVK